MFVSIIRQLLLRDLGKLKKEIELYRDEKTIWYIEKEIANSAGNLCLHLLGNLNTYVGAIIGNTGYTRNRDLEFSQKDVPRSTLLRNIDETLAVVDMSLNTLAEETIYEDYPVVVWEENTSIAYVLMHLATHLTYHLGQVNYHRRLLDK